MRFGRTLRAFVLASLTVFGSYAVVDAQETTTDIVNAIPKTLPLKVEIIPPKKSEDYPEKVRIKVTNSGIKPIVSLRLRLLIISDEVITSPNGDRAWKTIPLTFGRRELNTGIGESPTAKDPTISPNEFYVFRINEYTKQALIKSKETSAFRQPFAYRLEFSDLSYGDGSGYTRGGAPFSKKTNISGQLTGER